MWGLRARAARAAATALALAVIATACSGGDGGSATSGTSTTAPTAQEASPTELRPLSVSTDGRPHLVDDRGREVLLRGANLNALGDYYQADVDLPPVEPPTDADWDAMAANGFSVVRLLVHWSALEPERGRLDGTYVARIHEAVDAAASRGIYTVIDLHQDAWGKYIATPPGAGCPTGTDRAIGWDGAPEWATITAGASTCRPPGQREGAPAVQTAFRFFYRNTDGIRDAYVATVSTLAKDFATEPAVAGFDLFNEPNQVLTSEESALRLTELVGALVTRVRDAESQVEGSFPHLLFVEPLITFPLPGSMPAKDVSDDPDLVFAPHNYAEAIGPKILSVEDTFEVQADTATERGWPLWVGEYGVFSLQPEAIDVLHRFAAAEDAGLVSGSAQWQWRQRCGDPHTIGVPGYRPTGQVIQLNLVDCPEDRDAGPNDTFLKVTGRAYPRAAPGRLTSLASDPDTGALTLTGTAPKEPDPDGPLVVWVPDRVPSQRELTAESLTELTISEVAGGSLVTATATGGDYRLEVAPR